jgi:hypothetical protein
MCPDSRYMCRTTFDCRKWGGSEQYNCTAAPFTCSANPYNCVEGRFSVPAGMLMPKTKLNAVTSTLPTQKAMNELTYKRLCTLLSSRSQISFPEAKCLVDSVLIRVFRIPSTSASDDTVLSSLLDVETLLLKLGFRDYE